MKEREATVSGKQRLAEGRINVSLKRRPPHALLDKQAKKRWHLISQSDTPTQYDADAERQVDRPRKECLQEMFAATRDPSIDVEMDVGPYRGRGESETAPVSADSRDSWRSGANSEQVQLGVDVGIYNAACIEDLEQGLWREGRDATAR